MTCLVVHVNTLTMTLPVPDFRLHELLDLLSVWLKKKEHFSQRVTTMFSYQLMNAFCTCSCQPTQAEKLNVVTNHYKPGKDSAFPKVLMNGCNHSFKGAGWKSVHGLFTAKNVTVVSVCHAFSFPCIKK